MSTIKLLAIDLDHTLLDEQNKISDYNLEQLHRALDYGYQVVICTGRPWGGTERFIDQLPLDREGEYAISMNGAQIHELEHRQLVYEEILDPNSRRQIIQTVEELELPDIQLVASSAEKISIIGDGTMNEAIRTDIELLQMPYEYITVEEACTLPSINKLLLFADSKILDLAWKRLESMDLTSADLIRSLDRVIEAVIPKVNKASALRWLTAELKLQPEEVMVFGDGMNDVEMFDFAGYSVAMANAEEPVKARATEIAESNVDDGVGRALERLFLRQN